MTSLPRKTDQPRGLTLPESLGLGIVLFIAVFIAHFPATQAGYIWDDDCQLYNNPRILNPGGLCKIWFSREATDYWPLTSTSFWIEWRLWGGDPSNTTPYHVTNILLHAASAIFLWRILLRLGLGHLGAFLGGLLFAVHPITVPSVAWISERKNVLSMAFYLLSIWAYLRFDDDRRPRWYVLALSAGLAALLAKTSVVALPIVLLLLIWWNHSKLTWQDLLRTAPFFLFSLVLGLVTLWFHKHNSIAGAEVRPEHIASRIASVGWAFWFYVYKLVMPVRMGMIYPRWEIDGGRLLSYVPLALMLASFAALWSLRYLWGRGPLVAWATFAIVLSPILGLLDMAYAQYSLVADHLQYPGIPGIMALIGGGLAATISWARGTHRQGLTAGVAGITVAIVLVLTGLSWRHAQTFRDKIAFWSQNIAINDQAWGAYFNRGIAFGENGDYAQAVQDYTRCIELRPAYAEAYYSRSLAYYIVGNYPLALDDANKAAELKPNEPLVYSTRGTAYMGLGDLPQAIENYTKAIELNPAYARAYGNRGTAYFMLQEYDKAWADVTMCRHLGVPPNPSLVQQLIQASGRTE